MAPLTLRVTEHYVSVLKESEKELGTMNPNNLILANLQLPVSPANFANLMYL